jgi:hypothetical protein
MHNSTNRPVSVWATQLLLLLSAFSTAYQILVFFLICLYERYDLIGGIHFCPPAELGSRLLTIIFKSGALALMVIGSWGLYRPTKYGRWFGILFWAFVIVTTLSSQQAKMIYHFMFYGSQDLADLYPKTYFEDYPIMQVTPSDQLLRNEAFATIFTELLFCLTAAHFSFTKSVRQFFNQS